MKRSTDTYPLLNSVKLPLIGLGTYRCDDDTAYTMVRTAIDCGYRLIDTAAFYQNERGVGRAIRECGVPREELFVTSKLWNDVRGYDAAIEAFEATRTRLGLDYLDLYLIHWPVPAAFADDWQAQNAETWRALEALYRADHVRAIGVSNFMPQHLEALCASASTLPMVDQIEFHPGMTCGSEPGRDRTELLAYCKRLGIIPEAWAPFGAGKLLEHPGLREIAGRHGRSVAQICLRWCVQHDVVPLPKSQSPERLRENLQIFDFELDKQDMAALDQMADCPWSGHDPANIRF